MCSAIASTSQEQVSSNEVQGYRINAKVTVMHERGYLLDPLSVSFTLGVPRRGGEEKEQAPARGQAGVPRPNDGEHLACPRDQGSVVQGAKSLAVPPSGGTRV